MTNRIIILTIWLLYFCSYAEAEEKKCYSNLNEVLECFIKAEDNSYNYSQQNNHKENGLEVQKYLLNSQKWPQEDKDIKSTIWQHRLTLYIPENLKYKTAMLYIGGGYNRTKDGKIIFSNSPEMPDFINIARTNQAIVISLEDVPNQYLYINSSLKKEDQIIAFTYKKVIEDPYKNAYLAGHLPMTKAIIKAMDAVQEILQKRNIVIDDFMLVGASKRGWAAWLSAISDKRVSALIPIVIDILNVQKNIKHICGYNHNNCPPALKDYQDAGIMNYLNTKNFENLMKIEDPFSYINLTKYNEQFSIPKYIINASGDDFYAADSSKFYFKYLAGKNYIRFLPQAMHYMAGNTLSNIFDNMTKINESLSNFFYFHLNKVHLPEVSWQFTNNQIILNSSLLPTKVILWQAKNEQHRDFRCLLSYDKWNFFKKIFLAYIYKLFSISKSVCDVPFKSNNIEFTCHKDKNCQINLQINNPTDGWQASFIEIFYKINNKSFIVTTEMQVLP